MLEQAFEIAAGLARRWEGLRLEAYLCPAGVPTIGYGATGPDVKLGMVVTLDWAEERLRHDLNRFMYGTLRYCPGLINDAQKLAAITDFSLNLGLGRLQRSTLRRRVNEQDWPEAARELRKWVWAGGKRLPGLVARREAEVALLCSTGC